MKNKHIGSSPDAFLRDEGQDVAKMEAAAIKQVEDWKAKHRAKKMRKARFARCR